MKPLNHSGDHTSEIGDCAEDVQTEVVIIGAGPAGLAAAIELGKRSCPAVCLESTGSVGGICRTIERNGFRFDLGGHRFFTRSDRVDQLWRDVLGEDFRKCPRQSRIYYRDRFFSYPIQFGEVVFGLGIMESALAGLSYLWRRCFPYPNPRDFEKWATNQFGDRLYAHFFRSFTEKVWGIPCSQLVASWGSQRIRGLNLTSTVLTALCRRNRATIKTLIPEFDYPRLGVGQMSDAMAVRAQALGVPILLDHRVVEVEVQGDTVKAVIANTPQGRRRFVCRHVLSSMPLTELTAALSPPLPEVAREAALGLGYRDFITVNLILDGPETNRDTWIYIHDPSLRMGRLQFFANWSPDLVPDTSASAVGCEYFADQGDELWELPDDHLASIAMAELETLGVLGGRKVVDSSVVRLPKAYPLLDLGSTERVDTILSELQRVVNLQPIGRNGMFRYNNMDHSVLTGLLAAENACAGGHYDVWRVNTEDSYHEERELPEPD